MGDLTKNISEWEICCKCGCGLSDIDPKIVNAVQAVCTLTGRRVSISSGCRCEAHNKAEGGGRRSMHLPQKIAEVFHLSINEGYSIVPPKGLCKAIDFKIHRIDPLIIYNMLDPVWPGGLGKYKDFTHIDSRKRKARWG